MSKLILAEKPKAGYRINEVTGVKTVPAVGHLIELKPKARQWEPPYFDLQWVTRKKEEDRLRKIVSALQDSESIYIATDYDAEGQLIAYNILKRANMTIDVVRRMKFSSLENSVLRQSFENPIDFDVNLAKSAEVRHYLDWYFGMNISKALTAHMKKQEQQGIRRMYLTPVGRVQTPVLKKLVEKEKDISKFIATPVWDLQLSGVYDNNKVFRIVTLEFKTQDNAKTHSSMLDEGSITKIEEKSSFTTVFPPNKDYVVEQCLSKGISAGVVDNIMQDLYLDGYISYPRTTSTSYQEHSIDTQRYLQEIKSLYPIEQWEKAYDSEPREGEELGSHPPIYPIKMYVEQDLNGIVWRIIADAFLKCHLPPEERRYTVTTVEIDGDIYRCASNPDLPEGATFDIVYNIRETTTKPPYRYDERDLYNWMVESDLGTVDTRTQTIVKLGRTYIFQTDDGLYTSSKGIRVVDKVQSMYSDIVDVELTRRFEKYIEEVKGGADTEPILDEGREVVTEIVNKIREAS